MRWNTSSPGRAGRIARLEINSIYRPVFETVSRFNVIYGGAGSGKSYSIGQLAVLSLFQAEVYRKFLVCRKVARTLRESVWAQTLKMLSDYDLYQYCKVNKSDFTISGPTGNSIIFMGLDDVEKLKSIYGITDIWVEEASETSRDDLIQLNLRMRGGEGQERMYISFNPVSKLHWLKDYFFDHTRPDTYVLKTTYKDNPFLSAAYMEQIESYKEIDYYYYQVYALGEWGELGNIIFSNYTVCPVKVADAPFYVGVDFGFNHPSAIIVAQYIDGEIRVVDEFSARELTNADLIERARDVIPNGADVVCDSAEPDRIEEFNRAGFRARAAAKGDGSLRAGIDWLKQHRILIDESCVNLAKEMQGYKWIEDKDGNAIDKPIPYNDDCIAALRYAVEPIRLALGNVAAVKNVFWR